MCRALLDELTQSLGVPQIEHAHAAPRDFVLVRGPDPPPCRTDRLASLALGVDELVIRQHEMSPIAHVQSAFHVDAVAHQAIDLGEERVRIQNDAIADGAAHSRVKNATGDLVQHE